MVDGTGGGRLRRVARLVRIGGNEQLRREEEIGRAEIGLLVPEVLADPLRDLFLAALHFDHGEGNSVDEKHDVRADARAFRPIDRKLARHVEGVGADAVFVLAPVDVAEWPFARLAVNRLRQRDT